MSYGLQPIDTADESFLYTVYCSTRQEELTLVAWSEAQKEAFLQMQYRAQCQEYRTRFPSADWQVVVSNTLPIGRLIINKQSEEVRLVDIALLPLYCGQGIGSRIIKKIMRDAEHTPVRLHVSRMNTRAFLLYERLGFVVIRETDVHFEMEWVYRVDNG